ncbi:hypothetical protein ASD28_17355 [Massilia sp. Root133]|uniref:hypothetical protein n=1 Tax=unclassified Massilia TaxID=2609279 RepID=UPI0006FAFF84|nr:MULTISPECIES: hypothetical protein [unclassified Massilia]KQX96858.1 hypothetical protein ASD28_17355 [Massilia sp. Root133]KQZ52566.1 hypothetical protein ASD92_18785 [Massilia sp. Root1485]
MATDINKRLSQLRARRDGTDRMAIDESVRNEVLAKSLYPSVEPWEKRGKNDQPHTRYAIGAMQPVNSTYTRISRETADRVANQLSSRLAKAGITAEFRLQGSVPLDVHIRRVSDVDLLVIDLSHLVYQTTGVRARNGTYKPATSTSALVLSRLRQQVEADLPDAFPAATVDVEGAKAVKISGGSLPRSVDVVPAHWFDTVDYQATGQEVDRGVYIYNKNTGETIDNLPFLHIARVAARCDSIRGGLRKAIRLCKSVKADSDRDITLPSYDIAATMYHSDMAALWWGQHNDLAVLAETQRFLDLLARNDDLAKSLVVPDGSRKIFNSAEKLSGLLRLSIELDELLNKVYEENVPSLNAAALPFANKRAVVGTLSI